MIFCVEDDKSIRDLVIYTLTAVGYEAEGFATGEEMFKALEKTSPQLIMLDIMLPDEDGLAILKKLKSDPMTEDIPVIMATAKGTEYDKVVGLDLGADDYLAKPFGMMEMISRVKAVLRRSAPKEKTDLLRMGKLELDEKRHTVSVDGTQVQLTLKEYDGLLGVERKVYRDRNMTRKSLRLKYNMKATPEKLKRLQKHEDNQS